MNNNYFNAFSAQIPATEIATKDKLSYLTAATAVGLAGMPKFDFVDFDNQPFLAMLGGGVVAVDLALENGAKQRMWLPVFDQNYGSVAESDITLMDINNSHQRCLVKAIAAAYGNGMSLFLGHDGDGAAAASALGVSPESDLAKVPPIVSYLKESSAAYVEWGVALAAARITDPNFNWNVVLWDGKPFRVVQGGVLVDVETTYRGKTLRLSLPVMETSKTTAMTKAVPVNQVSAALWNKTMMRALTKCLAFNSGYGLSVYAELGAPAEQKNGPAAAKPAKAGKSAKAAPEVAAAREAALEQANAVLGAIGSGASFPVAATFPPLEDGLTALFEAQEPPQFDEHFLEPLPEPESVAPSAPAPVAASAQAPAKKATAPQSYSFTVSAEAATRFQGVMRKRADTGGMEGMLGLYEAIASSTKFTEDEKPTCFRQLTTGIASMLKEPVAFADVEILLEKFAEFQAMAYVAQDNRDIVAAKLVRFALESAVNSAHGDDAVSYVVSLIIAAGVAVDNDDILRLATLGNVSEEITSYMVAVM